MSKPTEQEIRELDNVAMHCLVALIQSNRGYTDADSHVNTAYEYAAAVMNKRQQVRKTVEEKHAEIIDGGKF